MEEADHLATQNHPQQCPLIMPPEFVAVNALIKEEPKDVNSDNLGLQLGLEQINGDDAPLMDEVKQEAQAVLLEPIEDILRRISKIGRYNDRAKCPLCSKELVNRWVLKQHIKGVHMTLSCNIKPKPVELRESRDKKVCHICNKALRPKDVSSHMRLLHPDDYQEPIVCKPTPLYFCAHCSYSGHRRDRLVQHITGKHFPKALACPDCPAMLSTNKELRKHKYRRHTTTNCIHCGKSILKIHFSGHLTKTACKFCDEVLKCSGECAIHRKACSKKGVCPHCERDFHNRDNLRKHKIICAVRLGEVPQQKARPSRAYKGTYRKRKKERVMFTKEGFVEVVD